MLRTRRPATYVSSRASTRWSAASSRTRWSIATAIRPLAAHKSSTRATTSLQFATRAPRPSRSCSNLLSKAVARRARCATRRRRVASVADSVTGAWIRSVRSSRSAGRRATSATARLSMVVFLSGWSRTIMRRMPRITCRTSLSLLRASTRFKSASPRASSRTRSAPRCVSPATWLSRSATSWCSIAAV